MATIDRAYWQKRSESRLITSEKLGLNAYVNINDIYTQAQNNIINEIKSLYKNYALNGVLSPDSLNKVLTPPERIAFLKEVREKALLLGLNPDQVFDERYLFRLTRLEALAAEVQIQVMAIAPQEVGMSENVYSRIVKGAYKDVQSTFEYAGFKPAFATLDTAIVDTILRSKWAGGNYSTRIWGNTEKLAQLLPNVLGGGISTGASVEKMGQQVRSTFDVGRYNALRLVRTETNYFNNQSELQSYSDDGIQQYEYDAILDERTSAICRSLNGQVFNVSDAMPGENYPPMHPNCRSTTSVIFPHESPRLPNRDDRTARYTHFVQTNRQIQQDYADKIAIAISVKKNTIKL